MQWCTNHWATCFEHTPSSTQAKVLAFGKFFAMLKCFLCLQVSLFVKSKFTKIDWRSEHQSCKHANIFFKWTKVNKRIGLFLFPVLFFMPETVVNLKCVINKLLHVVRFLKICLCSILGLKLGPSDPEQHPLTASVQAPPKWCGSDAFKNYAYCILQLRLLSYWSGWVCNAKWKSLQYVKWLEKCLETKPKVKQKSEKSVSKQKSWS
jgi:hypothetical protein